MNVTQLNFHHLRYFWAVARDGNLTHVAKGLRVSQSALSSQIHQLEEQLGFALFERRGRQLVLTEPGKLVLAYAEEIFATGAQLVATLERGRQVVCRTGDHTRGVLVVLPAGRVHLVVPSSLRRHYYTPCSTTCTSSGVRAARS